MDWLELAKSAYGTSTTYLDANWRKQWEDNVAHFQGRHAADSKYYLDSFKYRTKGFNPKTRSVVRKGEATVAAAFFSNVDVVTTDAVNQSDPAQLANAAVMKELLNYRLQKSIPWFVTLVGAFQEASVFGFVASYQYWMYETEFEAVRQQGVDEFGNVVDYETTQERTIEDRPCVDLIPAENLRFDPGADWRDPVKTSPYIIRMVPMYVGDVRARMQRENPKTGAPVWYPLEDGEIQQAMVEFDSIRNQRENQREDSKQVQNELGDFDVVWCHENFVRHDGKEYVYWTIGTQHLLTDPVFLKEAYWTGERPIVIGTTAVEAHKIVPVSPVELVAPLQKELNDIRNSRMDNVKLVLNKRWLVKRNKNVDIASLNRNVPGSVTLADDIADIQEVNWPDVTSSAYQEQDRINVDVDELLGNFSGSSVMTNRKLNETVGGMSMLNGSASVMTEYSIRTFVETWVEPVLRQLVKLEAKYETDQNLLAIVGDKAGIQRYGISQVTDELLNQDVTILVNVGMGATDPQAKLQKFAFAAQTVANISQLLPAANHDEIRKEIFGLAGYRDGARFFQSAEGPPPELMQAQQVIQQLQQALQQATDQRQMEAAKLQLQAQEAQSQDQIEQERLKLEAWKTKVIEETKVLIAQLQSKTQLRAAKMSKASEGEQEDMGEEDTGEEDVEKPNPLQSLIDSINSNLGMLITAQQQSHADLMTAMTRPKQVVRDPSTHRNPAEVR